MRRRTHQTLPATGEARETLRAKGQFWTPDWVADAMVAYALGGAQVSELLDPAVGAGAFFRATRRWQARTGRAIQLLGYEIDKNAVNEAVNSGLSLSDLAGVTYQDFLSCSDHTRKFAAIVGNPPYIRHHRLDRTVKDFLQDYSRSVLGKPIDGRTGLHVYFLIRALKLLKPCGRLAFILPADVCEGVSAEPLWRWLTRSFRLDAVVTFSPQATPFPGGRHQRIGFFGGE